MVQGISPLSGGGDPGELIGVAPKATYPVLGDRYTLGEALGCGGSATVFRAGDAVTGDDVAVKLFHPDLPESAQYRHHQELEIFRELRHPGLIELYDGGTYQGRTFLVMPLVRGPTLAERLVQGPLSVEETIRIGAELADALAYLHDVGITHRDIKPANVLLAPDGAKLGDFGIARYQDATQVTATGDVVGTAAYMAPEQVRSLPVGPNADIFALGLVLLECLTGRREYPGSIVESAVARLHRYPAIPGGLPGELADLLWRMTKQRPGSRPKAAEIGTILRDVGGTHALLGRQIRTPRPLPLRKRPRKTLAMLGLPAAAVAAVAIATGALGGPAPDREARPQPQPPQPSSTAPPTSSRQSTSTAPQPPAPTTPTGAEVTAGHEPEHDVRVTPSEDGAPGRAGEAGQARGHPHG